VNLFSDVIKHNLCCLESGAFSYMTVGRVVCFVKHPRVKAMNRSLPYIWVQLKDNLSFLEVRFTYISNISI
jgi:hypothetical protein